MGLYPHKHLSPSMICDPKISMPFNTHLDAKNNSNFLGLEFLVPQTTQLTCLLKQQLTVYYLCAQLHSTQLSRRPSKLEGKSLSETLKEAPVNVSTSVP